MTAASNRIIRAYDQEKDRVAVQRILQEAGWLEKDNVQMVQAVDLFMTHSRVLVAEINNAAECLTVANMGHIRYLDQDLPMSAVTAVCTSHVARRQGLARRLTARIIAEDVAAGAIVSALGMFEQGFYNRLGFGNGTYEHWLRIDPATLTIKHKPRPPQRLTVDDWALIHESRVNRLPHHGRCNLSAAGITRSEMLWTPNCFGLGYRDGPHGELTHHLWLEAHEREHGPYTTKWLTYQTREQLLELLALLKTLSDQIRTLNIYEPPGVQLQDLVRHPMRQGRTNPATGRIDSNMGALATWQVRICDLPACLAQTHLPGPALRFNLILSDPIAQYLPAESPWHGVAGQYVVTLGPSSAAEPGQDESLPTLETSVNTFTRMWLGVCPASGLAVTSSLSAPDDLMHALDRTLRLPKPTLDWEI